MLTKQQITQQLVNLYAGPKGFDFYEPGQGCNGICYGIIKAPDCNQVYLRGSAQLKDWLRDFMAVAFTEPFVHNTFGPVHAGAMLGMSQTSKDISKHLDSSKRTVISGHSLGGQRATLLNALFIQMGMVPDSISRITFGAPKAGFRKLLDYIAGSPSQCIWNSVNAFHDPVPMFPFSFPPEEYVQDPLTIVNGNPDLKVWLELGLFAPHHMPAYVTGVQKLLV
jgi:Lipase (class 3)